MLGETDVLTVDLLDDGAELDFFSRGVSVTDASCAVVKQFLLDQAKRDKTAVRRIDLRGANISAEGVAQLEEAAMKGALRALEVLGLSHSQIPTTARIHLLQMLRQYAPKLHSLDLSECELSYDDSVRVAVALPPTLLFLTLASNRLEAGGVGRLLQRIECPRLISLDVSFNPIDVRAAALIRKMFLEPTTDAPKEEEGEKGTAGTQLRELRLAHCQLDDATATDLAEGLSRSALQVLDLSFNDCAAALACPLSPDAPHGLPPRLRILDLSHNRLKAPLTQGFTLTFAACSNHLEELYLKHTLSGDAALEVFLEGVGGLLKLKVLDLCDCGLTFRSGPALGDRLRRCASLEKLFLSDNLLQADGIQHIMPGLAHLVDLQTLHVDGCKLGDAGVVGVVRTLVQSPTPSNLRELNVANNGVSDCGMQEALYHLSHPTSPPLRLLNVSDNSACTEQSQPALDAMLKTSRQSGCVVVAHDTPLVVSNMSYFF